MPSTSADINAQVKAQYEAFPYPNYPLLLPLRSQEAYASHSLFASRLLSQQGQIPATWCSPRPRIFLAGCGDVFPYMATFWEPRQHQLLAMDLSAASLRRARLRCLPRFRSIEWRQGNLEDADCPLPRDLDHIDSYGVLHHLANPARVLSRFGEALLPGGTARIMVYNSEARSWIRHLQRAFSLLGLSAHRPGDLRSAQKLLNRLAEISPALCERITPMRSITLGNPARLVDTFFHAREARLSWPYWLKAIQDSGLRLLGLFDRYGELDDLPNPLWEFPGLEAMRARLEDGRFENNFEIYLAKPAVSGALDRRVGAEGKSSKPRLPVLHFLTSPPRIWFAYEETRELPWLMRLKIWRHSLRSMTQSPESRSFGVSGSPQPRRDYADAWASRLPPRAMQRLARLGVFFPDDFQSLETRKLLISAIHRSMEPPEYAKATSLIGNREIRFELQSLLQAKGRAAELLEQVMRRLDRAQHGPSEAGLPATHAETELVMPAAPF